MYVYMYEGSIVYFMSLNDILYLCVIFYMMCVRHSMYDFGRSSPVKGGRRTRSDSWNMKGIHLAKFSCNSFGSTVMVLSHQSKTTTRQILNLCISMMPFTQVRQTWWERHNRNAQVQLLSCGCLVVVLSVSCSGVKAPLARSGFDTFITQMKMKGLVLLIRLMRGQFLPYIPQLIP